MVFIFTVTVFVKLMQDENIITSLAKSSSQWVVPDYDTDGSTVYGLFNMIIIIVIS